MVDDLVPPTDIRLHSEPGESGPTASSPGGVEDATSTGTTVGRYRLLERLGAGAWGVVWKAWDPQLDRAVALKLMRSREPAALARFVREGRVAARLRHPHLVAVHDLGGDAGTPWLAMEFVPGGTWEARLCETQPARRGAEPDRLRGLREEVELLADVAAGVAYAHAHGVVHRDLKPGNVLLDADGRPRVADFGLAWALEEESDHRLTAAGERLGTPIYMSPEQIAGERDGIGAPTDVWALGVTLYRILTGEFPFVPTGGVAELLEEIARAEPAPPRARNPQAPVELEAICLRALTRIPARRTPSAHVFAAELRRWLRGEPVAVRPAAGECAGRWLRRRAAWAAAGLALALLAAFAAGLRAAERARVAGMLAQISAEIDGLEDEMLRTPLTAEARRALAQQPLAHLDALVGDGPERGAAWSWRGQVLALLGRTCEAEEDLRRGCEQAPASADVWYLRAALALRQYTDRRELQAATSGPTGMRFDPPRSETAAEEALRLGALADLERMVRLAGPAAGERARLGAAAAALWSGRPGAHETALTELENLSSPRARHLRGLALYHLGRFAEACVELDAAAAAWPGDADVRWLRGHALDAAGIAASLRGEDPRELHRRALADFDDRVNRCPDSADAWLRRGSCRQALAVEDSLRGGDAVAALEGAVADLTEALRLAPDMPVAFLNRASALRRRGLAAAAVGEDSRPWYRRALTDLGQALRRAPQSPDLLEQRANTLRSLAQAEWLRGLDPAAALGAARADLDAAIVEAPEHAALWCARGHVWQLAGETGARGSDPEECFRRAVADCDEALRRAPDLAGAFEVRARARWKHGEWTAGRRLDPREELRLAISDYDRMVALSPATAGGWDGRGGARLALGDAATVPAEAIAEWRGAVADFEGAARCNPRFAGARFHASMAWRRMAKAAGKEGDDPAPSLRRAAEEVRAGLALNPEHPEGWSENAHVAWYEGLMAMTRRQDPRAALGRAVAAAGEALRRNPRHAAARLARAGARTDLAREQAARKEDARATLLDVIADCAVLLEDRAGDPAVLLLRGQARAELARAEGRRGNDAEAWVHDAEADLRQAAAAGEPRGHEVLALLLRDAGSLDAAVVELEALTRALPSAAAWADAQREEIRRRRDRVERAAPWIPELSRAARALRAGDRATARQAYELALVRVEETLAPLSADALGARLGDPVLRGNLALAHFNLACLLADEDRAAALDHLAEAVALGSFTRAQVEADPDLLPLKQEPRWAEILERAE